jgi:shikimate kinase
MQKKHMYLTGFMGSGKSTIGKIMAGRIGCRFLDTDDEIEGRYKKEVREIFADEGEAWFRREEEKLLEELAAATVPSVISLGGGALMSDKNQAVVSESGLLIYIKSSPENIYNRIRHSRRRPLLQGKNTEWTEAQYLARIRQLLNQRTPGYNLADIVFDRDRCDAGRCAELLAEMIQKKKSVTFRNR